MPTRDPDSNTHPRDAASRRRLQMADIARLAGVSVATVSRALNGSPLVNAETRERVQTLARELNYSINVGAQNLRLQRNQTIGVVIPFDRQSRQHLTDPFFLAMLGALADAVTERGYDMLLSRVDAENLDAVSRLVDAGLAVGVVMIGQWRHHDQLNQLAARRMPIVVWGAQMPRQLYCTVGGDNLHGGELAAAHLLSLGRRRLLYLGDPMLPEVGLRLEGCRKALDQASPPGASIDVCDSPFDAEAARQRLTSLLQGGARFDGIVAASDVLAITAMQVLRANGLRVPEDVAVVGYDDVSLARYCDPPLTSIHQPVDLAGAELIDALLATLAGRTVAPRVLPVHLVERRSSRS